jgi:hypothetical protein
MANPNSVPYNTYKEETERAIGVCYPIEDGNTLLSSKTLLFEIHENKEKYPLYSKVKDDKKKKLIMTNVCIYTFKWDLWAGSKGACRNAAVYKRSI